ncbi:hypothetical protein TWF225_001873 [Orbilia oligospora]|uniref:methylated diphthine methylhydrolase n=1 Tax=Orbilia oligospora TaxID=2813651 RepID=A0A7C8TYI1_ORBOL|nr:hypothetical protein TWF751_011646 [Orbilia oligospora]KAF3190905.1 hypothetical protein TWF225_001873 [Orbilia oligospora]KAF3262248.1 hypothetical protein TWF217_004314 [Orbilia oligospora]KAF3265254.1 hypothetical protein TWF128_000542 [Orbilia oligospora]TGJ70553.1 hypothetical protein EYR41_002587 [Orbilia oligospora]
MPIREPRFNQEKLTMSPPSMKPWKMSPPSMSPLHMTPPNMLLPNFSPPQFKLPTLSASIYFPPQTLFEEDLECPPSIARFSLDDPTVCVIGAYAEDTEGDPVNPQNALGEKGRIYLARVMDLEGEVRGDAAFPPDPPRKKIIPNMIIADDIETPGGIIDLCWSTSDPDLLIATTTTSEVLILQVTVGNRPHSSRIDLLSSHRISDPNNLVVCVAFSPAQNDIIAAGLGDGSVAIFPLPEELEEDNQIEVIRTWRPHGEDPILTLCFSNDGKELYVGDNKAKVSCWKIGKDGNKKPDMQWIDDSTFKDGDCVTKLIAWPTERSPKNTIPRRRPLLLVGGLDGNLRITDLTEKQVIPPPLTQEKSIFDQTENDPDGGIWDLALLPPIPRKSQLEDIDVGVFTPEDHPKTPTDPDENGVLVSCMEAGARVFVQREEFMEVFIRDPEKTKDKDEEELDEEKGVEKDWFNRERPFEWYNVARFQEHKGKCYSGTAVAFVDWDPIFKESGEQRKRRGWRLMTTSFEDRKVHIWQVFAD